jgi:hypothetical protein
MKAKSAPATATKALAPSLPASLLGTLGHPGPVQPGLLGIGEGLIGTCDGLIGTVPLLLPLGLGTLTAVWLE